MMFRLLPLNVRRYWRYTHKSQKTKDMTEWHKTYPKGQPQMRRNK